MSRERRDWTKQDPVKYFEEHYAGRITVKHQLREKDYGLYQKLSKMGKLEDVLPDSVHRDFSKIDAVVYFSEHYAGRITSRSQLKKKDWVLYDKLLKQDKLHVVLPSPKRRDFSKVDPVKFFKEHYAGKIATRDQLQTKDPSLMLLLRKTGKLDAVLPERVYRDYSKVDPVAYFSEHYAGRITTPGQLQKEDSGLFQKLRKMGKLDVVFPSDSKKQLEDLMDDFGGAQ
jgi:hypothetical protein